MGADSQIGVTGLAVMGANLARNIARHDVPVAVHNRTAARTHEFMEQYSGEGAFQASDSLEDFVASLERPRRIIAMVKAGPPVDGVIEDLTPLLDEGDIIIDAGNSHFADTRRRDEACAERGLRFLGIGVSGGEEGALLGPEHHARRRARGLRRGRGHADLDRRPGRRHALLRLHRVGRRGPLREDGPQRHRVRRHPADRRGLRPAAPRRRARGARDRRRLRRLEQRRPRVVPDRDHREGARQGGRGDRRPARGRDRRPGGAEGHRAAGRARTRSSSACR